MVVLSVLSVAAVAFYAFPGTRQPSDLYATVDRQVLLSLAEARGDYPLNRIDVGGTIWSYRRAGGGNEAVVFLHGMEGTSDIWWQQLRSLDSYKGLAANYGRVRTAEQAAAGIVAILDAEGVERAHIVGTSLGGTIAQAFATRSPERVRSLVLSNTVAPGGRLQGHARSQLMHSLLTPTWVMRTRLRRTVLDGVFPTSGRSALVRDYVLQQSYLMTREDFTTRNRLLGSDFDPPRIVEEQIPTLIIESDNDPLVREADRAELRDTYPSASVVTLDAAGHFPYLNRPAQYTRTLDDFFSSLRSADELFEMSSDTTQADDMDIDGAEAAADTIG